MITTGTEEERREIEESFRKRKFHLPARELWGLETARTPTEGKVHGHQQ